MTSTMSTIDKLLEAARYLEMQEQLKEQQQLQQPFSQAQTTSPTLITTTVVNTSKHKDSVSPTMHRVINNSFDIINPLVIDESGEQKRKQPPLVFRAGTREVHNKLEKHRRAHLKECFDFLKKQLPSQADEKKTSNLSILHSALRFIQTLKRKERELEHELERLAREKIAAQQRLATLKKEMTAQCDGIDFGLLLPEYGDLKVEALPIATKKSVLEKEIKIDMVSTTAPTVVTTVLDRLPIVSSPVVKVTTQTNGFKESIVTTTQTQQSQQPVQTTALSVLPMAGYPVNQGLVLHKVALVPKGITDLSPLAAVSSPVAHFIAAPAQQINGKVLPVVNAQYVVKPVVVVSSPATVVPRPS